MVVVYRHRTTVQQKVILNKIRNMQAFIRSAGIDLPVQPTIKSPDQWWEKKPCKLFKRILSLFLHIF